MLMVGYGSIGRGTLPLLERHFKFHKDQLTILAPSITTEQKHDLQKRGYSHVLQEALSPETYYEQVTSVFGKEKKKSDDEPLKGIFINVSVETSSVDLIRLCRELNVLYIDTVVEPWKGYYDDPKLTMAERSNYALREELRQEKYKSPGGTTAISCCGANPGMVSWFVKAALLQLTRDILGPNHPALQVPPRTLTRENWAALAQQLNVQGIQIAERDTQVCAHAKPPGVFRNTWSVDGFISEGLQQSSELGWGTHEKWWPENAHRHKEGCKAAIYLDQPGGLVNVRGWCPTNGAQTGFLVTHNEAISISDYYTVGKGDNPTYRPTCMYAYHMCDDAILSVREYFGNGGTVQKKLHLLNEKEIISGMDELGVLLYGHGRNALWYGSTLTHENTLKLIPEQNATGLQVTSAVLAGLVWGMENPQAGIVEADEMDHERCLEIQTPYLGRVWSTYTNWTPATYDPKTVGLFPAPKRFDRSNPWNFSNILV